MKRMKEHEFKKLINKIRDAGVAEKASIRYWAGLALKRRQYGSYVYVHVNAPNEPTLLTVYTRRWGGKSNNTNHSDVTVGVSGYAAFGTDRLWKIINETK